MPAGVASISILLRITFRKFQGASKSTRDPRYHPEMALTPEDLLGFIPDGAGEFDMPAVPAVQPTPIGISAMINENRIAAWLEHTATIPFDGIDREIVEQTYATAVWLFRAAAVTGDLKAVKSLATWLNWAKPIMDAPQPTAQTLSPGSVAFLPRTPQSSGEEVE